MGTTVNKDGQQIDENGNIIPSTSKALSNNMLGALSVAGNLGSGIIDSIEGDNTTYVGQGLSGALQGASAGLQFGPVGAIAGGILGAGAGVINESINRNKEDKLEKQKEKEELDAKTKAAAILQAADIIKNEQSMASGGIVKGKKGIDKIETYLTPGTFIIPKENANHPVIKKAMAVLGYDKADKNQGDSKVWLTDGEIVIRPEDVGFVNSLAKDSGLSGIEAFAPNATDNNKKSLGGDVKGKTVTVPVGEQPNLYTEPPPKPNAVKVVYVREEKLVNGQKTGKFITVKKEFPYYDPGVIDTNVDENSIIIPATENTSEMLSDNSQKKKCGGSVKKMAEGGFVNKLVGKNPDLSNMTFYEKGNNNFRSPYYGKLDNDWYRIDENGKASRIKSNEQGAIDLLNKTFADNEGLKYNTEVKKLSGETAGQFDNNGINKSFDYDKATYVEPKITPAILRGEKPGQFNEQGENTTFQETADTPKPEQAKNDVANNISLENGLGMIQAGLGAAGSLSMGKEPIDNLPEYKISPEILSSVTNVIAKRDKGLNESVKNAMLNNIEAERQNTLNLAKEYSNGSSVTAFNRAILANSTATQKKNEVAALDQEEINKNADRSFDATLKLENLNRTLYEDKMERKGLDQTAWEKKQSAWASLLNSGIDNIVGAKRLKEEKLFLENLKKQIK